MKHPVIISSALALLSSAAVQAGLPQQPLGVDVPPLSIAQAPLGSEVRLLGDIIAPLGSDMSLPMMAVIGTVGLIAGIRYIRNKRS